MKKKLLIASPLFLLLVFLFYWFQWRPTQIRHDCSWVKVTKPAVPAYPAKTEDELKAQGLIKTCTSPAPEQSPKKSNVTNLFDNLLQDSCQQNNQNIIFEYSKPREAIPAQENWRQATEDEYKFCLHNKGL